MSTLVCVPIMVEDITQALSEGMLARAKGADLVEWRIDPYFPGAEPGEDGDTEDAYRLAQLKQLIEESPLPCILTCRSAEEGGDYDGDDADRVSLLEKLCCETENPPAYLDFELKAYTRSANIRQKINLCVAHPKQQRDVRTKLILSTHDFEQRPADLDRQLLKAYDEPACTIVKVAYRARSLRDNLDLFELTQNAIKPTIALGMGEFGLMSRVLAPKFGGYLTFASLRDSSASAPGQPTIDDLLGMYRFRKIGKHTKVYGVIGWPVSQSMGPLIHNAGFGEIGWDGVYLPLPIVGGDDQASGRLSFATTTGTLLDQPGLRFSGASVTLPHKTNLLESTSGPALESRADELATGIGAANTLALVQENGSGAIVITNTDALAIRALLTDSLGSLEGKRIAITGAGGAARAGAYAAWAAGASVTLFARTKARADALVDSITSTAPGTQHGGTLRVADSAVPDPGDGFDLYINCTPVGMANGPDPEGLSIPQSVLDQCDPLTTTIFDTVYNPIETPVLLAAKARGFSIIDGVQMFVRQASAQFELWTGKPAPSELFDRLCRQRLSQKS